MRPRFLSCLLSNFQEKEGDNMCFAGIEENVRQLLKRKELAEEIAAKAHIRALTAQVRHGQVHLLVENEGWIRSVDLLERHKTEGFEPITRPVEVRFTRQPVNLTSR
ncbi:MAG: hypothetical protein ACM3ZT_04685 [Bacillota bacterium]